MIGDSGNVVEGGILQQVGFIVRVVVSGGYGRAPSLAAVMEGGYNPQPDRTSCPRQSCGWSARYSANAQCSHSLEMGIMSVSVGDVIT